MSEAPPLNAVIFGCGRIAGGFDQSRSAEDGNVFSHCGAYRRHNGFKVVACVDTNEAKRRAFMSYWDIQEGYATVDDWLAADAPHDVASICTPTEHHAGILDTLLPTAIRGVIVEKPGGYDSEQLLKTANAYRKAEKTLIINYTRRFDPAMAELRAHISSGKAGLIRNVAVFYNKGIRNNGTHAINLVSWLLSSPLTLLSVAQFHIDHDINDPTVNAVLSAGNVPVHLIGSDARDFSLFEINVVTEYEIIEIKNLGFTISRRAAIKSPHFAGYNVLGPSQESDTQYGTAMLHVIDQLHQAVCAGREPVSSGETAATTLALAETIINQTKANLS